MQVQLFISSSILFLSLARASLACGADTPDQVPTPQFSLANDAGFPVLKFHNQTAQTIFEHLADPEVRRFNSDFYQLKIGFGLICMAQTALQHYTCFERFVGDGEIQGYFPYSDSLKKSKSWLDLKLKGSSLQQLYTSLADDGGDMAENDDGSLTYIKQKTAITCQKTVSMDGSETFDCSQFLSAGGLPIGTGTDPMIGSGTHPVMVDVEEGITR